MMEWERDPRRDADRTETKCLYLDLMRHDGVCPPALRTSAVHSCASGTVRCIRWSSTKHPPTTAQVEVGGGGWEGCACIIVHLAHHRLFHFCAIRVCWWEILSGIHDAPLQKHVADLHLKRGSPLGGGLAIQLGWEHGWGAQPVPQNATCCATLMLTCNGDSEAQLEARLFFGGRGVQAMASWRSPLTRMHLRNLSRSRIRAVQCYDCPKKRCGS